MNTHGHDAESRLARLLAASQAPADDAPLTRALARLAERDRLSEREPAWMRWLARPAALAAACALLVMSVSASAWLLRDPSPVAESSEGSELIAGLIGEDGSFGLVASDAGISSAESDSGGER